MFPPTVREPVPVMEIDEVAAFCASRVAWPMVRLVLPAKVREPALILRFEMAVLTVVAAFKAEFCAPMVKAVFTVVAPPVMLMVASVLLPVAKPAATVLTPIVTVLIEFVPPLMSSVELASPVELPAVSATLFVLIVTIPMVKFAPRVTLPVTDPEVNVVPVRDPMTKVVASRVPLSKVKVPVPLKVVAALRAPTVKVLRLRVAL